ncbi:MAG: cytochrome c-type biogenesis protein CcmH [Calditrichaeota bacterium]|nr:MAG: cytochrome c-type biogenesis protein CcmH [Calditrichota bacterium]
MFKIKISAAMCIMMLVLPGWLQGQEMADSTKAQQTTQPVNQVTKEQVDVITSQLIAPCCWSETANLHNSAAAIAVQEAVLQGLQEGKTEEQIKAAMVAQYGERILATPKLEGFNYFVFILPVVALLIGGYLVWIYLARHRPTAQKTSGTRGKSLKDYDDRIEKELQKFDN